MVLQVKLAYLLIYSKNDFINSYHNYIIDYIIKSGYYIENNKVIIQKNKIKIPNKPDFIFKSEFKDNILGSQYFIN
jgi:hypothetical protein